MAGFAQRDACVLAVLLQVVSLAWPWLVANRTWEIFNLGEVRPFFVVQAVQHSDSFEETLIPNDRQNGFHLVSSSSTRMGSICVSHVMHLCQDGSPQ